MPVGGRRDAPSDDAGQDTIVTRYGRASKNWPGSELRMSPSWPGGGAILIDWPIPTDDAKSSAAPNAPSGVQRPTIIAARPMNPRPAVIPCWNDAVASMLRNAPPRPAKHAASEDVAVAQPDDVDADRLGRPGCSPTARLRRPQRERKRRIWNTIMMNSSEIVIGPWAKSVLEDPADERQVGQEIRRRPRRERTGAGR